MKTQRLEECSRPLVRLASTQVSALALDEEAMQTPADIVVDLSKFLRCVARAEVVPPPSQHWVEHLDQDPQVPHPVPLACGQLLHALPYALHASLARPALQEVHALALLLSALAGQHLAQVAAEEVEALLSPAQLHSPRLVGMDLQLQPLQDLADPSLGLLARLPRPAHDDE